MTYSSTSGGKCALKYAMIMIYISSYPRLFFSLPLIFFGAWCYAMNYTLIIRYHICSEESSLVPLLGTILLCAGLLLLPDSNITLLIYLKAFWWFPIFIDVGILFIIIWCTILANMLVKKIFGSKIPACLSMKFHLTWKCRNSNDNHENVPNRIEKSGVD